MISVRFANRGGRVAPRARVAESILAFIAHVPGTREHEGTDPASRARHIAHTAAAKAALAAGGLALPPGPLGWLTVLPELVAVWKLQAQMVADIAASYGREASLTREHMLYCLFRHTAAQAVRDLVVRVGERVLVHRVSLRALQAVAGKVGVRLTQRAIGKGVSRWVPVVGALGVGAYAYYDTGQVARTAIDLFEQESHIEAEGDAGTAAASPVSAHPSAPSLGDA
jgi:hypothetical protein